MCALKCKGKKCPSIHRLFYSGPQLSLEQVLKDWKGYPDLAVFCYKEVAEFCLNEGDEFDDGKEEPEERESYLGWLQFQTVYQQKYLLAYSLTAGEHGFGEAAFPLSWQPFI